MPKQSLNQAHLLMDCFASLAMTQRTAEISPIYINEGILLTYQARLIAIARTGYNAIHKGSKQTTARGIINGTDNRDYRGYGSDLRYQVA